MRVSRALIIRDGGILRRGWGIAYWDAATYMAVVLPIPLNLVVGALVSLYHRVRAGIDPSWLNAKLYEARESGYRDGRRDEGREAIAREVGVRFHISQENP